MQDDSVSNNSQDNTLRNTDDPIPQVPDDAIAPDDPATDSSAAQDSHEIYDEGIRGAAEAPIPNEANDAVIGYNPEDNTDDRNTSDGQLIGT